MVEWEAVRLIEPASGYVGKLRIDATGICFAPGFVGRLARQRELRLAWQDVASVEGTRKGLLHGITLGRREGIVVQPRTAPPETFLMRGGSAYRVNLMRDLMGRSNAE